MGIGRNQRVSILIDEASEICSQPVPLSTYCMFENKARADGRRLNNITQYQELWDLGKTRAPIGDRHPNFRFTL